MWKHFQEGTIGDKGGGRAFMETELALLVRPPAVESSALCLLDCD